MYKNCLLNVNTKINGIKKFFQQLFLSTDETMESSPHYRSLDRIRPSVLAARNQHVAIPPVNPALAVQPDVLLLVVKYV